MNFPEKSMDALVIEAEVMAAFRAHMKASSKQKQLTRKQGARSCC